MSLTSAPGQTPVVRSHVRLAGAMAARMVPAGVEVVVPEDPGAFREVEIAVLREVGLPPTPLPIWEGPVDVALTLPDAPVPTVGADDETEVLRAARERIREHLRRELARNLERPVDPEAPFWIRDPERIERG